MELRIEVEVEVEAEAEVLVVMEAEVWVRERVGAAMLARALCVHVPGSLRHSSVETFRSMRRVAP